LSYFSTRKSSELSHVLVSKLTFSASAATGLPCSNNKHVLHALHLLWMNVSCRVPIPNPLTKVHSIMMNYPRRVDLDLRKWLCEWFTLLKEPSSFSGSWRVFETHLPNRNKRTLKLLINIQFGRRTNGDWTSGVLDGKGTKLEGKLILVVQEVCSTFSSPHQLQIFTFR